MKQASELLITVVIPTRNIAAYLPRALASVVAQGGAWRVVGVDSGSTDGTRELWSQFAAAHPGRVTVLDEPECRLAEAVNVGIVAAAPGLIQWIGGDDQVAVGAHAEVRAAAAAHPGAGWFVGDILFVDEAGAPIVTRHPEPWSVQRMVMKNRYFAAATLYHRHFVVRAGLTSPALPRTMDYELWFRLAWLAPPVTVGATLAAFTIRKDAISGADHAPARTAEALRIGRFYAQTWREQGAWRQAWLQNWLLHWPRHQLSPLARPLRQRLGRLWPRKDA